MKPVYCSFFLFSSCCCVVKGETDWCRSYVGTFVVDFNDNFVVPTQII